MFNPEPMAPFLDAIFIGEGDEAIEEIVDVYQLWKKKNAPRGAIITGSCGNSWNVYSIIL